MSVKEPKSWYQKGAVQAAFVAGGFGFVFLWLQPDAAVVIIQEQPKSLEAPAVRRPDSTESRAKVHPAEAEPPRERRESVRIAEAAREPERLVPQAPSDLEQPKSLSPDVPWVFPSLSTSVTASFRETLGSRYVEIVVATPDVAPDRFPARSAGASRRFTAMGALYEVQILAIDWNRSRVDVIVRAVSGP